MGIALATKLTAAVGILGICAYAGVAGLARLRAHRAEAFRMIGWSIATGLLASVVWVAVYPYLWPNPVTRTLSMFELQREMMEDQGANFGHPVVDDLAVRLNLMVVRTFVEISTPPFDAGLPKGSASVTSRTFTELPTLFGISIELALALLGLAVLIARAARGWRAAERHGPDGAALVAGCVHVRHWRELESGLAALLRADGVFRVAADWTRSADDPDGGAALAPRPLDHACDRGRATGHSGQLVRWLRRRRGQRSTRDRRRQAGLRPHRSQGQPGS
jgi:hypothetical protein